MDACWNSSWRSSRLCASSTINSFAPRPKSSKLLLVAFSVGERKRIRTDLFVCSKLSTACFSTRDFPPPPEPMRKVARMVGFDKLLTISSVSFFLPTSCHWWLKTFCSPVNASKNCTVVCHGPASVSPSNASRWPWKNVSTRRSCWSFDRCCRMVLDTSSLSQISQSS